MNLLLVHSRSADAAALERSFANRAEIKICASVADAVNVVDQQRWCPDLAVLESDVGDAGDQFLVGTLQRLIDPAPIVIGARGAAPLIEARIWQIGGQRPKRSLGEGRVSLESIFEEQQALAQSISAQRMQIGTDVERAATRAAEAAVSRAIDQLVQRLGLDDAEGLRLAIRFARGWETAKSKFLSAVTTGIASAFLLAIGAGIISMLRNSETK